MLHNSGDAILKINRLFIQNGGDVTSRQMDSSCRKKTLSLSLSHVTHFLLTLTHSIFTSFFYSFVGFFFLFILLFCFFAFYLILFLLCVKRKKSSKRREKLHSKNLPERMWAHKSAWERNRALEQSGRAEKSLVRSVGRSFGRSIGR